MLLAYIYRSITHRVHFLDKASRDLFSCAKNLLVEAKHGWPANFVAHKDVDPEGTRAWCAETLWECCGGRRLRATSPGQLPSTDEGGRRRARLSPAQVRHHAA